MPLIVEDGTGLANAESYASVAEADSYYAKRANETWDAVDDKEAALRKATDFMLQRYTTRWSGQRKSVTQALDWPRQLAERANASIGYRYGAVYYDDDAVPDEVKKACIELALRASSAALIEDLGREISSESIAGAVSTTYVAGSGRQTSYVAVDAILAPALAYGSGNAAVVRA